jgi:hypothetical protein
MRENYSHYIYILSRDEIISYHITSYESIGAQEYIINKYRKYSIHFFFVNTGLTLHHKSLIIFKTISS